MPSGPNLWLALRVVIVAVNIVSIASVPRSKSNLDWTACALIALSSSAAIFAWLTAVRNRNGIDWSDPFTWRKPFLPMARYPLRFWFLSSVAMVLSGIASLAMDVIAQNGREAFGGTFLALGLALFLAIELWLRMFGHRSEP